MSPGYKRTSLEGGDTARYSHRQTHNKQHASESNIYQKVNNAAVSSSRDYRERLDASITSLDTCCGSEYDGNRTADNPEVSDSIDAILNPTTSKSPSKKGSYKYTSLRSAQGGKDTNTLSKARSTSNITERVKDRHTALTGKL